MKMKKYLACLMAALMMASAFTACGGEKEESKADSAADSAADVESAEDSATEAETEAATMQEVEEVTQAETEPLDIEPAISAESGQAYLAICEEGYWVQYWGDAADGKSYMLSYDAQVATIDGDGSYTVGVTTDTNGYKVDAGDYVPWGLVFSAIIIKDGSQTCPNAVITIDSILVDGKEIEMTAKNYTSSDDGVELRSNIYNGYMAADALPGDARSAEGALFDAAGNKVEGADAYSPHIVNPEDFKTWNSVEVNFTITGLGEGSGAAEGEDSAAEEETAAEEAAE